MKRLTILDGIDSFFLISFSILVVWGLIILQSASSIASFNETSNGYFYFARQLTRGVFPGIFTFALFSSIPYLFWKKWSPLIFLFILILNTIVLVPGIGVERLGATRWIDLGVISVQPSEFMKISIILYIGTLLVKLGKLKVQKGVVFSILTITALTGFVVAFIQRDLSTAVLIMTIIGSMVIQSPIKLRWIVLVSGIILIGAVSFAFAEPFRMTRIITFLQEDVDTDILDSGYHSRQNLIAVGSGGLFGVGWNQSRQKFNYVPEPIGDSVFAVFAEEAGFLGVVLLLTLFSSIVIRLIQIAMPMNEPYAQYIIIGVITWFVIQSFFNIGSTLRLIPLTGMPLPFISYGSSSLWGLFIAFGIVANITKYRNTSKK